MELTYSKWQYWLARRWETTATDKAKVIGVAMVLLSYGTDGASIYPSAKALGRQLNVHRQAANDLRMRCIELGLFEVTGHRNGVPVLRISIPVDGDINDLRQPARPAAISDHMPTSCDCTDCAYYLWRYGAYCRAKERIPRMAKEREERKHRKAKSRPEPIAETDPWADEAA